MIDIADHPAPAHDPALVAIVSMGEHGPIWSIGKIDEVKLPAAALQNAKDFMSYERAKDEWAAMAARHKFEAKHGKGG